MSIGLQGGVVELHTTNTTSVEFERALLIEFILDNITKIKRYTFVN